MKLNLKLDRNEKSSLYLQLYKHLKKMILQEEINAHTRLPAIRSVASQLGINPATVVKAYDLLAGEELIYQKVGSGSYVAPQKRSFQLNEEEQAGLESFNYGQIQLEHNLNFASATPSAALFPVDEFKYAIDQVLDRDGGEAFTYQDSQGFFQLRESIAEELVKYGVTSSTNNIQIVSGAQQAIDLLAKTLLDYGDRIIVEEPTYSGALSAFQSREARIKTVAIEADGMDLDELEEQLQAGRVKLVYMMSTYQNPTGINWSREKKEKLVELAATYDFYIIEDDCLSDLYYQGECSLPVKAYDRVDRVIYIKSFSKIFMPGLRLAYLVLPQKMLSAVLAAKYATDISSAGLTQRALDFYLREGLWEKHLARMRQNFGRKFQLMKKEINHHFPAELKPVYNPEGGLYFWFKMPEGYKSEELYLKTAEKGVAFLPGSVFLLGHQESSFFRLSFAAVNEEQIKEGIRLMGEVSHTFLQKKPKTEQRRDGYTPLL